MHEFTDSKGETWDVAITGATVKRAAHYLDVDLGNLTAAKPDQPALLTRIDTDIVFLVDLLFVVCKPQADARKLADVDFAERLAGETLRKAHDALLEALSDFYQSLGRPDQARAIEKQREVITAAVEEAEKAVAAIDASTVAPGS